MNNTTNTGIIRQQLSLLKRNELSRLTACRAKEVEARLSKRIEATLVIQRIWRKHVEKSLTPSELM